MKTAFATLLTLCSSVYAQLSVPGTLLNLVSKASLPNVITLEQLDNAYLLMKSLDDKQGGGFVFGEPRDVSISVAKQCKWQIEGAYKSCQLLISSPGALSMSILFSKFHLPSGAELYVSGRERTIGAFVAENNNRNHLEFAIQPMEGDSLLLNYISPLNADEPIMEIDTVVHGFRMMGESGKCNINVKCPIGLEWADQIKATALMISDRGSKYCSGAFINSANPNGAQLFLTAAHCVGSDLSRRHVLLLNYQHPTCENGPKPTAGLPSVQGLKLLAKYGKSDVALFEVEEQIPCDWDVFMSGWNASTEVSIHGAGIHHPSTDVKKISFYSETLGFGCWDNNCPEGQEDHWKISKWTKGTTEPGSSGSPLYNSKKQIIGQLHGGSASCGNPRGYDVYGGLFISYNHSNTPETRLFDHLNPLGLSITEYNGAYFNKVHPRCRSMVFNLQ